jgi:hypothetical protein
MEVLEVTFLNNYTLEMPIARNICHCLDHYAHEEKHVNVFKLNWFEQVKYDQEKSMKPTFI